jgi:hypothetical protein
MIREETFARFSSILDKLRRWRIVPAALWALAALVGVGVVRLLSPERKTLVFDLGVGVVLAAVLFIVARRLIAAEARRHRRVVEATLVGIIAGAAALGVFAVSLLGKPIGAGRLPQLVAIQLLGAVAGAAVGFFAGFFAAAIVSVLRRFVARPSPAIDGGCIGALSGLAGGLAAGLLPHLGGWFTVASVVVCAVCGYRAARLHEEVASSKPYSSRSA